MLSSEIPEQAIPVGSGKAGVVNSADFACSSTLGENAVAFDFGLPSEPVKCSSGNPVSNSIIETIVSVQLRNRLNYL